MNNFYFKILSNFSGSLQWLRRFLYDIADSAEDQKHCAGCIDANVFRLCQTPAAAFDITHGKPQSKGQANGQQYEENGIGLPRAGNIQPQQAQAHSGHAAAGALQPCGQVEQARHPVAEAKTEQRIANAQSGKNEDSAQQTKKALLTGGWQPYSAHSGSVRRRQCQSR